MSEEELRFRLKVAARVLEKAAAKARDRALADALRALAAQLRSGSVGPAMLRVQERRKTIDDIVREVREWIWSDVKEVKVEKREGGRELPEIDRLEAAIDKIIEEFDKRISKLDKLLEVLP